MLLLYNIQTNTHTRFFFNTNIIFLAYITKYVIILHVYRYVMHVFMVLVKLCNYLKTIYYYFEMKVNNI